MHQEQQFRTDQGKADKSESGEVLGYAECARLLQVSERTLGRWVQERRIPYVQFPKRGTRSGIRFVRAQVLKWLEQQTVRATRPRSSWPKVDSNE
jgi:excisionase family DNA binding protein